MKMKFYLLFLTLGFSLSFICNGADAEKTDKLQKINSLFKSCVTAYSIYLDQSNRALKELCLDIADHNLEKFIGCLVNNADLKESCKEILISRETFIAAFNVENRPEVKKCILEAINKLNVTLFSLFGYL